MNTKTKDPVMILIGLLALCGGLIFAWGVVLACIATIACTKEGSACVVAKAIPPFLSTTTIAIAGVFATNLGAVIGVTVYKPQGVLSWNPFKFFQEPSYTALQVLASYFYVFFLIVTFIVWGAYGKFEDGPIFNDTGEKVLSGAIHVAPLIPSLAKSFVGIVVGALGVILTTPKPKDNEEEEN